MTSPTPGKRVAIDGARGIGRYHANWWALEGAEVGAIHATTPETAEEAAQRLRDDFGFSGQMFTSIQTMLREYQPDILDVCSPPAQHAQHVRQALAAGIHVLCEKPFLFDPDVDRSAVLANARGLFDFAESRNLMLSVSTQYTLAMRYFTQIWKDQRAGQKVTFYKGILQTPAFNRLPEPVEAWMDLAPHPLSAMLELLGPVTVDWSTLGLHFEGYNARAVFTAATAAGDKVDCDIVTGYTKEAPNHVRYFQINDYPFNVILTPNAAGVYETTIEAADGFHHHPDLLRTLIGSFLRGEPVVSRQAALDNLDIMLRVIEEAKGLVNLQSLRRLAE